MRLVRSTNSPEYGRKRNAVPHLTRPLRGHPPQRGGHVCALSSTITAKGDTMYHNKKLTARAQELRKNMTKEERRLWYEYLRNYPKQFRRQVAFGNYILDFYCASAKLAIELDGSQHYEPEGQQYDNQRTAFLNSIGIEVLRFSNKDVLQNLRGVCQMIDMAVERRVQK